MTSSDTVIDTVIAALRSGHDALAATVSSFSDDDLARPSGSSEWDVSEVLSHLGSGAEIGRATLAAALAGAPAPGRDFMTSVWDRWNAMTRRLRADGFLRSNRALTELYESLDAETRANLRVDLGFLPEPLDVAALGRMRLSELTLHAWDVHVAFDEHATLAPDAVPHLLDGAPGLIGWAGKPERLDGERAAVLVTTTEPATEFTLRLDERITVDSDLPDKPDGTLLLPAEAWLRLVAGRLAPRHTPEGVATTGAADLGLLRRVFPGY
ncbi:maleylpyruvate isomerase family mycothiol-dependent enzyme [Nonomuraea sp. FMUSA5-5]|uniref:Maleylpyruvate isomerase family mycothiol-dependent enzyme n=1 Tax=Nonomuraea composti TaxID=2720023 RepID=A0ABX1BAZ5_9ACTN|nr:maleylpyruvate isomerase family mycothiol-dependent enzyme [Nonomuraea sp. FMUSA5-5]NJP92956.1 maleylpyruvate isomerase family mycothiol-dependent enzyme [Nonomuraea sp. FMUSA5-5]